MAITLGTIAQACDVDVSTVSRALRDDPLVNEKTAKRIRELAAKLGYHPNMAARNLRYGKTQTIWFLLPSLENILERSAAQFANEYLARKEYDLLVALHNNDSAIHRRLLERLKQKAADGVIIVPSKTMNLDLLRELRDSNFPLVFLDRHHEELVAPVVTTANHEASVELVRQCAEAGARHFLLTFSTKNPVTKARLAGAKSEIKKLGLDYSKKIPAESTVPIAILGNAQFDIFPIFEEQAESLRKHKLIFGVYDQWQGSTYPAESVFVVYQNFKDMAVSAADIVLGLATNPQKRPPRSMRIPIKTIEELTKMA